MFSSLAAQGLSAERAAVLGVWLHGAAGDEAAKEKSPYSMIARDLADGQQLYILTQEEMEQQDLKPGETATAQNNPSGTDLNRQDSRVNINTADESQLTTLTGIGATRAKAIIAYREENGPFATIEDIMNVQGIKEGTFVKIKDEIVVG